MAEPTYSLATEQDVAFLCETYRENIASLHGNHRSLADWKKLLANEDTAYYVVRTDTAVAWFRVEEEDGVLWLGMLQVKPKYQRRGIGRYVLSVLELLAKEKNIRMVGMHTTEDNFAARTLYQAAGFTVTEIGPCTTADGVERVGYTFRKQFDACV